MSIANSFSCGSKLYQPTEPRSKKAYGQARPIIDWCSQTKKAAATLIMVLLLSAAAGLANVATANPDNYTLPIITMPEEQVSYIITRVNGTLWAKIDGTYPLRILTEADGAPSCAPSELPMVYPTPPGTTNMHVKVDGIDLDWDYCPQEDTHHTAIGNWNMIYCMIAPVPEQFMLEIHYEHPLEQVNGSYIFLYDLNISPYLSPWSPNSTAYFAIRMDTEVSNLHAYTTETDTVWNPINYTVTHEGDAEVVTIQMHSEYSKPLLGDLAVMFSNGDIPELPLWMIPAVFVFVALVAIVVYKKSMSGLKWKN
jgi:hypothetical protein